MFETLSGRLGGVLDRLRHRRRLGEADVAAALREVRVALLEADVALPVVKDFVASVGEHAVGHQALRGVAAGQQVVKIVHDRLVETLGPQAGGLELTGKPPVAVMLVGLQGSGKTTTTAKLGHWLQGRGGDRRVLMASLDTRRPAAREQLALLGAGAGIATLDAAAGEGPVAGAQRAMDEARRGGLDTVLLDTAGRLHIDDELMAEAAAVARAVRPPEVLLVADAMTGQDAVNVAAAFRDKVGITGIVLTRTDGDARGGAALSMRAVTGCPIKLLGTGEKIDALEAFHPDRIASRILGMGDVVGLVEKAAATVEREDAERLRRKFEKGQAFDLDDMRAQLGQLRKMGGMGGLLGMLPGAARARAQMAAGRMDERALARQEAILSSMTPGERRDPRIVHASRKRRIAAGAGVAVQDINRLLKQFQEMNGMMKKMRRMGRKGALPPGLELPPGGDMGAGAPGVRLPPGLKF